MQKRWPNDKNEPSYGLTPKTRMEQRRLQEIDEENLSQLRRGWCFGEPEFKKRMLKLIEEDAGGISGEIKIQTAFDRAAGIIEEELKRLGWSKKDLKTCRKNDPGKLGIASRLRKETTLTIKAIAELTHWHLEECQYKLHAWMNQKPRKYNAKTLAKG